MSRKLTEFSGIEKDVARGIKQFESFISDLILKSMAFYTKEDICDKINIDEKTLRSHKKNGKVPPKYYKDYFEALKQANKPALAIKKELKNHSESWELFNEAVHETFAEFSELADEILYAGEALTNYFLDEQVRSECYLFAPVFSILGQWKQRIDFSKNANVDPIFFRRLNMCFNAFSSIKLNDFIFLSNFYQGNEEKRNRILVQINKMQMRPTGEIVSSLLSDEGKLWIKAYTHYVTSTTKERELNQAIKSLRKNIKEYGCKAKEMTELSNLVAFLGFVTLIWPHDDEADTKFGAAEICAIIQFKFFLTEESQQEMVDKFLNQT